MKSSKDIFKYKSIDTLDLESSDVIQNIENKYKNPKKLGIFIYRFPAKSNTFIMNEFLELINNNVDFHIYSMDRPSIEDLDAFDGNMDKFEGKITYLNDSNLFRWGSFIKNNIAIGPNPIRRKLNESSDIYIKELESLDKCNICLEELIKDIESKNIVKLYAPFANLEAELCMMISKITNMPYYFSCHSHDLFKMFGYEQLKMESASKIFCISQYNKDYILSKYKNINPDKLIIKRVNYLKSENIEKVKLDHPYIFSAGRLIKMKGFEYSIKAFHNLLKEYPDFHYYIAGSGPEMNSISYLISTLKLNDRIHLLGHIPNSEVLSYIKGSKFNILSSIISEDGDMEGIPTFFIESMSCGIPCIGTNYSGIPELIDHGINGMLTEEKNELDIYENMKNVIQLINEDKNIQHKCKSKIDDIFNNKKNSSILINNININSTKKILIAGMQWTKDKSFGEIPILPYGLNDLKKYNEEFKFYYDIGVEHYESHTKEENFDMCIALHGNRKCSYMDGRFKYLDSICHNIWCINNAYLDNYITFDKYGYKGGSSLALGKQEFNLMDISDDESKKFVDELFDTYIKPKITDSQLECKKYIIFAGQMPDDSSIPCAYPDQQRLYNEIVIKALARLNNIGIPIFYKSHPCMNDKKASNWAKIQETTVLDLIKYKSLKNVHLVKNMDINDLIKNCSLLISICSGSAFETLLHRKPVINLGQSDLNHFIYKVDDLDELIDYDELIKKAEPEKNKDAYIYSYVKQYIYPKSPDSIYNIVKKGCDNV